jgi:predicted tellurium resistance membrane protein TerC
MAELLTIDNLLTLLMLIFLQAVLGFDNLLYISIESKRVAEDKQPLVRKAGIGIAILLRIVLLFVVIHAIGAFQEPFASVHWTGVLEGALNVHATIVLCGGVFIIYTALKEIYHMLSIDHLESDVQQGNMRSVGASIAWIVAMNIVFSFDSILSAIALTDVFAVMAIAVVVSGVMMMVMADKVAEFLKRNRMYEVLGLFILLIVGVMLVSEGGHLAHLRIAGNPVEPMAKTTFYFVIVVLVIVDIAQGRYHKKLHLEREREVSES